MMHKLLSVEKVLMGSTACPSPLPHRILAAVVLVAIGLHSCGAAIADERITSFDCRVVVGERGMLSITETITVVAEGNAIKRGIYRDIPVRYGDDWFGLGARVPFSINSIECDGEPTTYHTENNDSTVRVYIGDAATELPFGEHTYVVSYETRQLRFFDDHDEVYWNATGNAWAFPIEKATASVVLPGDVPEASIEAEAYLGPLGSSNQAGVAIEPLASERGRRFTASRMVPSGDGLTVVVQFAKNAVTEPSALATMLDDPYLRFGLIAVAIVVAFFTGAWWLVGRDPATGVVIPLFAPPDGLSPAACRFVSRMGFDKECFSVALLSLGSHGCLTIHERGGVYTIAKTAEPPDEASPGEKQVFRELLGLRRDIEVKQTYHEIFSKAIADLKQALVREFEGTLFLPNRLWFFSGVGVAITALFATVLLGGGLAASLQAGFLTLWLSVWSIAVVGLIHGTLTAWRSVFTSRTGLERAAGIGKAVFVSTISIPFVGFELFAIFMLSKATSIWMVPVVLGIVGVVAVFYELIKAPTAAGRAVMDRIDGFRMYLSTAEQDRLEAATQQAFAAGAASPQPRSLELFERFLPYAVALGVANAWAAQFQDLIEAASAADASRHGSGYHPAWYQGTGWSPTSIGTAAAGLGSAMTAAVAAAATSPSSGSSGGGGGGSSGGGGGGGGGGGW